MNSLQFFDQKTRKSYSFSQKLTVIQLYEKCLNFSEVSKITGIDRKCIRDWVKRKDDFRQVDPNGFDSSLVGVHETYDAVSKMAKSHSQSQYTPTKSRSNRTFSVAYKLEVIAMHEKLCNFTLLSRATGVDRKCIRDWVSKKDKLIEQQRKLTGFESGVGCAMDTAKTINDVDDEQVTT
jgi:transposase-like protein